jgi:hypothetical protein
MGMGKDTTDTKSRMTRFVIGTIKEERQISFKRLGKPQAPYIIQARCRDMASGIDCYNDERFSIMQTLILTLTLILLYFLCVLI